VKNLFVLGLGLCVAVVVSGNAMAENAVKSGPQKGDRLGAFYVTKVAGAESDGVSKGQNLCYRCKNGSRPQVIVFTRSTDKKVAQLVKNLDKAIASNESSKLRVFVNLLGDDKEGLEVEAQKFAATSKAKNVPFVVPNEFENGPDNYGINAKAAVTITLAGDSGVKGSYAVSDTKDLDVKQVMSQLKEILN